MRHRKKVKKLGLSKEHRDALLKQQLAALVLNESIKTTEGRAKALAARMGRAMRFVQQKEKREAIRALVSFVSVKDASAKFVDVLKARYESRNSGFTRITRIGLRKGDAARLVQISLV